MLRWLQEESAALKDKDLTMGRDESERKNMNVYVRLHWSMKGPGLPKREGYMDIWMKGAKFRVRDETGRHVSEILGDITTKRGLGQAPLTIEDIMDISSGVLDGTEHDVTELFGDLATNRGLVNEPGQAPWTIEAETIAPAARQIFTDGMDEKLVPVKSMTKFGRICTEYHGVVEGQEEDAKYRNAITRIVSPPFIFQNEVHDAENTNYYYIHRFVEFAVGKVTNEDLEPPDNISNNNSE